MKTATFVPDVDVSGEISSKLARIVEQLAEQALSDPDIDVQALLAEYPQYAAQLETLLPAMQVMADVGRSGNRSIAETAGKGHADDHASSALGDFHLIREIGRGGMGIVYEAEQLSLRRRVAVKVLPLAGVLDKRALARFQNESRAAATLFHPHIVPVFFVGVERGVHFYAMQFIEGMSLAEVILECGDSSPLISNLANIAPTRAISYHALASDSDGRLLLNAGEAPLRSDVKSEDEAPHSKNTRPIANLSTEFSRNPKRYFQRIAEIGIQAGQGLHYAHDHGILHRDVKPGNILLDQEGQAWITDFGLARLEADPSMTASGDLLGTLRYMSPEQLGGIRAAVNHRTDIYSLGITLYELATGVPAFAGQNRSDLLRRIAQEDPRPPRQVRPEIPPDLETIILKAIEKNPGDRYASAAELAEDLRCYANDESIRAKPPTRWQRASKWCRRHTAAVWSILALLIAATFLLSVSVVLILGAYSSERQQRIAKEAEYQRAERERQLADQAREHEQTARTDAERQRNLAAESLYLAHMRLGQRDWEAGQTLRLFNTLEEHLPAPGRPDPRGWEWYYLLSGCYDNHRTMRDYRSVWTVAWAPDGRRVAFGGKMGICFWDPIQGGRRTDLNAGSTSKITWSPTGKRLAAVVDVTAGIRVWDVAENGETTTRLEAWPPSISSAPKDLAWSSDGTMLAAVGHDPGIDIWNIDTGEHLRTIRHEDDSYICVAWHPNRPLLAVGGETSSAYHIVEIVDASTGDVLTSKRSPRYEVLDLAWRPDGAQLAASFHPDTVSLWSFDGARLGKLRSFAHTNSADGMAWNSTGEYLATASRAQQVVVWHANTGNRYRTFQGHLGDVLSVDWSPDDKYLVSGGNMDATARVWDVHADTESIPVAGTGQRNIWIRWSPDGSRILHPVETGWQVVTPSGESELAVELPIMKDSKCSLSPDGRAAALFHSVDGAGDTLTVVHARTGEEIFSADIPPNVWQMSWSPDSKWLAVADEQKQVSIWNTKTWKKRDMNDLPAEATGVAFSPDSMQLAVGTTDGVITLCSVNDSKPTGTLRGHQRWIGEIAWSPDGRKIAAGGFRSEARVWDVASRRELCTLAGHIGGIMSLTWHPDGERIASGSGDGSLRVWKVDSGDELLVFQDEGRYGVAAAWSPDGMKLASRSSGRLVVRDASAGYAAVEGAEFALEQASVRRNRAEQLASGDRDEEAEQLYREAVGLRSRALGPQHPSTLESVNDLAFAIFNAGRQAEGQKLVEETLELQRRIRGNEHLRTLLTVSNLAYMYERQNEFADAVRLRRELVEANRGRNDNDPKKITSFLDLINVFAEQGSFAEAYAACGDLLDICRKMDRLGDWLTMYSINQFFAACEAVGRHAEAKEVWEEMRTKAEWDTAEDDLPEVPFAEYRVRIDAPGEYQLYLRYGGHNGESDSLWCSVLGEDNEILAWYLFEGADAGPDMGDADADFATHSWETFGARRGWSGPLTLEQPALFEIPAAGEYVIRLMRREGGVAADALVLQQSHMPPPKDNGPAESPRDESGAFIAQYGIATIEAENFSSAPPTWRVVPGDEKGEVRHKNFRGSGYLLTPE